MKNEKQPTSTPLLRAEQLLKTGEQAWMNYEVQDALDAWQRGLELVEHIPHEHAPARVYLSYHLWSRMAELWLARRMMPRAIEAVENVERYAETCTDTHPEWPILGQLWRVRVARQQRDMDRAQALIRETLRKTEQLPSGKTKQRTLAQVHFERGMIALTVSENQEAMDNFTQARTLYQQLGDRADEARCVMYIGRLYKQMNLLEQSIAHYQEAEERFQDVPHNPVTECALQLGLGSSHGRAERYMEAVSHYQAALDMARRIGSEPYVAGCLNNVGVILQRQGETEKAFEIYEEALELFRRMNDRYGISTTLHNLGEVYLDLEDAEAALLTLKQAIRTLRDIDYRAILPETYCMLSITYLLLDRPSTAFDHAEKGLQLAEEIGNLPYAGMAYRTLGIAAAALERRGNLPSIVPQAGPEAYFSTSMEILSGLNFSYEQARTLLAWGTYLSQSHDPSRRAKGESYLKRAAEQFGQLDLPLPRPSSLGQRKLV